MLTALRWLAKLKFLRGSAFDVFGKSAERRLEQRLIVEYEQDIAELLHSLDASNLASAIDLAGLPEHIRGFGHVKLRAAEAAQPVVRAAIDPGLCGVTGRSLGPRGERPTSRKYTNAVARRELLDLAARAVGA